MNKLFIAAGAVIAGLLVAGPSTAQAASKGLHVDATIHLAGQRDHYRPDYRPDYRPYRRSDYRPYHRPDYRPYHRPAVRDVLPRWQVIRLMHRQGYRACRGWQIHRGIYALRCVRHGRVFAVRVNGWTGHIIARHRIG